MMIWTNLDFKRGTKSETTELMIRGIHQSRGANRDIREKANTHKETEGQKGQGRNEEKEKKGRRTKERPKEGRNGQKWVEIGDIHTKTNGDRDRRTMADTITYMDR